MGLFSMISNAVREGKEKAIIENMKFSEKLDYYSFDRTCTLIHHELKGASLSRRPGLIKLLKEHMEKTNNKSELFPVFCKMHALAYSKQDTIALSISTIIGKKLYEEGDFRVEANSDQTRFRPKK